MLFQGLYKAVSEGCSKLITKIQTPQEEVCKSHKKYDIRIFLFKYEYNISNKRLKLKNKKAAVKQKNLLFTLQQYYD